MVVQFNFWHFSLREESIQRYLAGSKLHLAIRLGEGNWGCDGGQRGRPRDKQEPRKHLPNYDFIDMLTDTPVSHSSWISLNPSKVLPSMLWENDFRQRYFNKWKTYYGLRQLDTSFWVITIAHLHKKNNSLLHEKPMHIHGLLSSALWTSCRCGNA